LTEFLAEPLSFTSPDADSDIAGKRVGELHTEKQSWRCPGDDESIFPIDTIIVNMIILEIVNAAITGMPDPSQIILNHWGC
jgi:hypothetical protein